MAPTPEDGDDESKLELPSLSIFRWRKKDSGAKEPTGQGASEPSTAADSEAGSPSEAPEPRAELGSEADEPDLQDPGAPPEPEAEVATMFPDAVDDSGDAGGEPTEVLPAADIDDQRAQPEDESQAAAVGDQEPRERKPLTLPALAPMIAAPVTGLVVGLVGVALTFITQRGCEAVKGTGSCGGVGLFFLIAILALMVLFGAALLKGWQISDPTSSSFLAVGLVAVLAMLFFLPEIDTWYMVIVIPVLTAMTYLLSWWVTRTFIESAEET